MSSPSASLDRGGKPHSRSLLGVLLCTGLVSFNDNFVKILVISVTVKVAAGTFLGNNVSELMVVMGLAAMILFSPIAGFLADRFSKAWLLAVTMYSQAALFLWMILSMLVHSPVMGIIGFALLTLQSTFFSPAKIGILKEVAGHEGLARATGLSNMISMLSIIAGIGVAGPLFDGILKRTNEPWTSALYPIIFMTAVSFASLAVLRFIKGEPAQNQAPYRPSVWFSHFGDLKVLWRDKPIRLAGLGVSVFWGVSFFLSVYMVDLGVHLYPGSEGGAATVTSNLAAMLGIGTGVGSLLCAMISRGGNELGIVPIGAIVMVLSLLVAGFVGLGGWMFHVAMAVLGIGGGLFLVPLMAQVQDKARPEERGRMQAALNLQDCLAGLLGTITIIVMKLCRIPLGWQLILLAIPMGYTAWYVMKLLPGNFLRVVAVTLTRLFYRIKKSGTQHVPATGPALLVSNHMSYVDAFLIGSSLDRTVRFLVYEEFMKARFIGWALRVFGAIPISSTRAKDAIRTAVDRLKEGEVVCIFPEGQLTRTGLTGDLRKGVELIARQANCPVVPVWLNGLWGSVFSFKDGAFFWKKPESLSRKIQVSFGDPIPPREVGTDMLRQTLQRMSALAWSEARAASEPALTMLEKKLNKNNRPVLRALHASGEDFPLTGRQLWELSGKLATKWSREIKNRRIALAVRPGRGAAVAMLALLRAGKTGVLLDAAAMADVDLLAPQLSKLKIDHLVCQNNWLPQVPGTVFAQGIRLLDEDLLRLDGEEEMQQDADSAALAPEFGAVCACLEESGWTFRPIPMETILRNARVIDASDFFRTSDVAASNLSLNHPAGLLFSLFYPMLSGREILVVPAGGDTRTLNDILRDQSVTVFLTDPESAAVLKKFQALDHRTSSLRHVSSWVTSVGAAPADFLSADGDPHQGIVYTRSLALRESGLLATVSFPNPLAHGENAEAQYGWRESAYGRPFPDLMPPEAPEDPWTGFAPFGAESAVYPPLWQDSYGLLYKEKPGTAHQSPGPHHAEQADVSNDFSSEGGGAPESL